MADDLIGRQAGFSLIEAMIALLILSVSCVGVIGMFLIADRAAAHAAKYDGAAALAREVMEEKRALPFDELTGDGWTGDSATGPFHRRWQLRLDQPAAGLATLSVEVTWQDAQGRTRRLELAMVRGDGRREGTR